MIESSKLLQDLIEQTRNHLNEAEKFKQMPLDQLNWKKDDKSWSILECLEHTNLYGDFYLPEIEKSISSSNKPATPYFKPGILGDYFAKSMLPREKLNTMKTFKDKNPAGSALDKGHIDRFIEQQKKILELLDQAQKINLSKTKTATSISRWVKLRVGDTFRVIIYHNERHIVQANKILPNLVGSQ